MKIIVLNSGDLRIEVISVPDHLVEDGKIEEFLQSEYYPLNNFSWMAGSIGYVPVTFHEYDLDDTGNEIQTSSNGRLTSSIYESVQDIKRRERDELCAALINHGKKVDDGYEYTFSPECPIIAAYNGDEPCDVVILSVRMDKKGILTIVGEEKLDRTYSFELDPDNIFAGQLSFVTSEIVAK